MNFTNTQNEEIDVLMRFLSYPLSSSAQVLEQFAGLSGAVAHFDGGKNNFVYVPGSRPDRVLLVAHADTVWDDYYLGEPDPAEPPQPPVIADGNIIRGGRRDRGLGADDRAGCAMLWLLRGGGHSLLVTDGEEHGQIGANHLTAQYPQLSEELNAHSYMLQLDRRGNGDYKTYKLPVTEAFRSYIEERTGLEDAGWTSRTDIVALCKEVCGVNFSVGYYNEHTPEEYLDVNDWLKIYRLVRELLQTEQPRFPMYG